MKRTGPWTVVCGYLAPGEGVTRRYGVKMLHVDTDVQLAQILADNPGALVFAGKLDPLPVQAVPQMELVWGAP